MVKSLLFYSFLFVTANAAGQNNLLKQAVRLYENGALQSARAAIDTVVINSATRELAKAWYYRGEIYHSLYRARLAARDERSLELLKVSYRSFLRTIELDEVSEYDHIAIFKVLDFEEEFLKTGVASLNDGDYEEAYQTFKFLVDVRNKNKKLLRQELDPQVHFYMAYAASFIGEVDEAKKTFNRLIVKKYDNPVIYNSLAEIYKDEEAYDSALTVLDTGIARYPDDLGLLLDQINIYMGLGETGKSIKRLKAAIALDSANYEFHFTLASLYDGLGDEKNAIKHYKRAIKLKPDYLDAHYNLAVLFYNKAIDVNYNLKSASLDSIYIVRLNERNAWLSKAKPYFEKSHELDPDNEQVLRVLNNINQVLERK